MSLFTSMVRLSRCSSVNSRSFFRIKSAQVQNRAHIQSRYENDIWDA